MSTKYVYTFGDGKAEGKADMKSIYPKVCCAISDRIEAGTG